MPIGKGSFEDSKKAITIEGSQVLLLKQDAKIAKIRFITPLDQMFWAFFHSQPKATRMGKMWYENVYCLRQDQKDCQYCDQVGSDLAKARRRLFFWVYTYGIYFIKQDKDGKRTPVAYLGENYFYSPVNDFRILETGPGQNDMIWNKLEKTEKRFQTLLDRDYDWSREGSTMNDTLYDLVPCESGKTDLAAEVVAKIVQLPSLEAKVKELYTPKEGLKLDRIVAEAKQVVPVSTPIVVTSPVVVTQVKPTEKELEDLF